MSTKKPSSPKPSSPDAKDLKSPKGDAVVQDPKAKPGNPKQQAPEKPAEKGGKPEKGGKADKSPEPVDKNKQAKDNKNVKGKPSDNAGIFLTEGKHHDQPPPKPENVLISSGLLEAYDYLQRQICKHGLPKGNAFEFAAITFLKYERKLKAKEADKRVEVTNKEQEKAKKVDVREVEARQGRSPRGHEDTSKNASSVKSPQGKDAKSPPPKEEPKGKGGKGDKSPPPKEEEKGKGKGGKDDKERSKSPPAKDMKKEDAVVEKGKKGAEAAPAKKK